MLKIGLISDTHGWVNPTVLRHFANVDEIWHAGDIGDLAVVKTLETLALVRAVYGNIDSCDIRLQFPETLIFSAEGIKVLLTHIGGYPGRYAPGIRQKIYASRPKLFICGHSHICKIMYDDTLKLLHINPGAAGSKGFHNVSTIVRFSIANEQISDLEVIEFNKSIVQ